MKRSGRPDDNWHEEGRALFAEGMKPRAIGLRLGVSADRVCRALDPGYAAHRNELSRKNRTGRPRHRQEAERPPILATERTVVKELWDGRRISLPRVAWLERPMPGASA